MTQPWLPLDAAGSTDLERRAIAFDLANPAVYLRLVALAREAKRHGVRRVGMKALFERLRWDHALHTKGEPWRLNNAFTSYYARKLLRLNPEFAGLFETRRSMHDAYQRPAQRAS